MTLHTLPGFDNWLCDDRSGDGPTDADYKDARDELPHNATDDEIERLAWTYMQSRLDAWRDDEADSLADDRDDICGEYYDGQ
jgi:hypothetical protein